MSLTGLAFMFAFLALLGLALVKHPRFGLYAYMAAFYVHPPSRWWGAGLPDLRWSLLASAVTLIAVWRSERRPGQPSWLSTTPAKILILFTIWIWIQSLWAMAPDIHFDLAVLYSKYLVLFYLIYRICSTPEEMERFLISHVAGCMFLGYLALGQQVSGRLEGVGGPGIDEANAMAMQLATAVMPGAMIVLMQRNWKLVFAIVAMALILNAIVLAGSRGAFIAILAGGVCLWLTKPREHRVLFYMLAGLGVMLFLIVANKSFWERMSTMEAAVNEQQEMDNSAESRFALAEAQFQMAVTHPLGTGHRGTEVLSKEYLPERFLSHSAEGVGARSSHNSFLSAWVEQGIPGAVMFLWMVLWCWRASRSIIRDGKRREHTVLEKSMLASIGAALLVVLVAGLFVDYIKAEVTVWLLALLASLQAWHLKSDAKALAAEKNTGKFAVPTAVR